LPSYASTYFGIENNLKTSFPGREFTLIAVSKTKPYEVIREAYLQGIRVFGENYIPEAIEKFTKLREEFPEAKDTVFLHHIGPTQSGTLRKLFGVFQFTHGVGSFSTLKELLKRANKEKIQIAYFFQVNITSEETKHGLSISDLINQKGEMQTWENEYCRFEGFMGMGPSDGSEIQTKEAFAKLANLRDEHFPNKKLSMGMSGDFEWAMEFRSDYLRIGSLIFGDRSYAG